LYYKGKEIKNNKVFMRKITTEPQNPNFTEKQAQTQVWIFVLIAALLLISIWAIIQQNIIGTPFGNNPAPDWFLWISPIIPLILLLLVARSKMVTHINEEGIWLKYLPFHSKYRFWAWDEINSAYIRKYKPLKEFTGYGIRRISWNKSEAYSVKKRTGLQLTLNKGKRLLIGTNRPNDIKNTLEKLDKA